MPVERDLANGASYKGQWKYSNTRHQAKLNNPNVLYGVDVGPNKNKCENDVCICQPVGAVRKKRVIGIYVYNGISAGVNPYCQFGGWVGKTISKKIEFGF